MSDRGLEGRVVVVFGAGSSGAGVSNGQAAALAYAAAGASVAAVNLDPDQTARVANGISSNGGTGIGICADVTREAEVVAAMACVVDELGVPWVIHNNVGVVRMGSITDIELEAWDASLTELFDQHHYQDSVIFGHAKDGNIHFLLNERFDQPELQRRYTRFTENMVELVLSQGGTLKAEHGTGRIMAPFVRRQYGDQPGPDHDTPAPDRPAPRDRARSLAWEPRAGAAAERRIPVRRHRNLRGGRTVP